VSSRTDELVRQASSVTPEWLLQREVALCPCGCIGKRSKVSFIDKTISGASSVLRQALFTDDIATRRGLLQRLDPRVKTITTLAIVIAAALVRNIPVLVVLYAAALLLAITSKIPLGYFIKRVWLFVPIFTGIVVLPATFSFVTHGHIVVPLGHWFGHRVGLTSQGLRSAGLIVIRVATSISFVVLLALTTTWTRLLAALRSMLVPRMFVLVLGMAYRYVFHLLGSVTDMYEARKARTVQADNVVRSGRAFVSATAGTMFGKAHAMSEEVYQAMVSRGYTCQAQTFSAFRIRAIDVAWIACCALSIVLVVGVDRAIGR
jgi:cobalt/nickel transport system permease protein